MQSMMRSAANKKYIREENAKMEHHAIVNK